MTSRFNGPLNVIPTSPSSRDIMCECDDRPGDHVGGRRTANGVQRGVRVL